MLGYVWFWGGMVLTMSIGMGQTGPFGWMALAQNRVFGTNDMILDIIPVVFVWLAPLFLAGPLHRLTRLDLFAGMQQASDRLSRGRGLSEMANPRRTLQRQISIARTMALSGLAIGGIGSTVVFLTTGRHAGQPLPAIDYARAIDPDAHVPAFLRLRGATARPDRSWVHRYTFRSDRHHDIYTAVVPPDQTASDPVRLLVQDVIFVDGNGDWRVPPTALEGTVKHDAIPDWQIAQMRRSGLALVDSPVLLVRDNLHGVQPGPDLGAIVICAAIGISLTVAGVAVAWQTRRRMDRIVD